MIAGYFSTNSHITAKFALQELDPTGKISFSLHLEPTLVAYNIIMGRYILKKLGIIIYFKKQSVTWNHVHISMKITDCTTLDSCAILDPDGVEDMISLLSGDQYSNVQDAKYKREDLKKTAVHYKHLSNKQLIALLNLLTKYK